MSRSRAVDWLLLRPLADRDRRAVLLGAAVLLPAILYLAVGRPYRAQLLDLRDRIAAERALLERESALVQAADALPDQASDLGTRFRRAEARLVRAANVPLAEAELTAVLEETALVSRVLLQEMRTLDLQRDTAGHSVVRPLRLSVRGESDLEGVLTYLHRLENNPLLLRIIELSIEPMLAGGRGEERTATGVVQFALVVEGYTPAGIAGGREEESQ